MSARNDATGQRFSEVLAEARTRPISFDDTFKFVFFSDCHRGDNSWADDFAPNQMLAFHAMQHYLNEGYTYIELGDGDELWQNPNFENIRYAHNHIFWVLSKFHECGRLYMVWGNHDIERSDPEVVAKQLYHYYDDRTRKDEPLLPGLVMHEGLVLKHTESGVEIFAVHGHQGSRVNDRFWRFGRLAVRYGWSRLQAFGIKDPTRPSQDRNKQRQVETQIKEWIKANDDQIVICGHTHRPEFPYPGDEPYFNIGSCVHPRCITCIELNQGMISLVKWWTTVEQIEHEEADEEGGDAGEDETSEKVSDSGPVFVKREVIRGPKPLQDFYPAKSEPDPATVTAD